MESYNCVYCCLSAHGLGKTRSLGVRQFGIVAWIDFLSL